MTLHADFKNIQHDRSQIANQLNELKTSLTGFCDYKQITHEITVKLKKSFHSFAANALLSEIKDNATLNSVYQRVKVLKEKELPTLENDADIEVFNALTESLQAHPDIDTEIAELVAEDKKNKEMLKTLQIELSDFLSSAVSEYHETHVKPVRQSGSEATIMATIKANKDAFRLAFSPESKAQDELKTETVFVLRERSLSELLIAVTEQLQNTNLNARAIMLRSYKKLLTRTLEEKSSTKLSMYLECENRQTINSGYFFNSVTYQHHAALTSVGLALVDKVKNFSACYEKLLRLKTKCAEDIHFLQLTYRGQVEQIQQFNKDLAELKIKMKEGKRQIIERFSITWSVVPHFKARLEALNKEIAEIEKNKNNLETLEREFNELCSARNTKSLPEIQMKIIVIRATSESLLNSYEKLKEGYSSLYVDRGAAKRKFKDNIELKAIKLQPCADKIRNLAISKQLHIDLMARLNLQESLLMQANTATLQPVVVRKPVQVATVPSPVPVVDLRQLQLDERQVKSYIAACNIYINYLKEQIKAEVSAYQQQNISRHSNFYMAIKNAHLKLPNATADQVAAGLLDLYNEGDADKITPIETELKNDDQIILRDALRKYQIMEELKENLELPHSASQRIAQFHAKLAEPITKKLLTKRRDTGIINFAKGCGMCVATILGLSLVLLPVTYLIYRGLFGETATRGSQFIKEINAMSPNSVTSCLDQVSSLLTLCR
jgi:hypothetical protein